jgi:hypothetical protein
LPGAGRECNYPVFAAKTLGPQVTIANTSGERKGKWQKNAVKMQIFSQQAVKNAMESAFFRRSHRKQASVLSFRSSLVQLLSQRSRACHQGRTECQRHSENK